MGSIADSGQSGTHIGEGFSRTSMTLAQVRKAHEMVLKIARDAFDFEQDTIQALNELAVYIASLEQK